MRPILVLLGGLSVLAACATPTPYQPAVGTRWGYEETQIEADRYRISFGGNSLTERETVETYLLYRAAELTLEHGYDHFIEVQRATDRDSRYVPMGPDAHHIGFRVHYAYWHPRWGWRSWRDPFWDDVEYREVTRFEASAEVVMGRGPKPQGDPHAFNARDVIANLGAEIVRPEPE